MMLFRKTLHTLEGVIGELGADGFRIEDAMLYEFALQFGLEWPRRWLAPPDSRVFATRLSNLDIAECIWRIPLTAARYVQGELEDAKK
jgi:putative copper export protein